MWKRQKKVAFTNSQENAENVDILQNGQVLNLAHKKHSEMV